MSYLIRDATFEDLEFIQSAQILMARETEKLELDPPTVKKGVTAVLQDPSKGRYFIAETKATPDANSNDSSRSILSPIACLLTIPEWSDWRNGTVTWIHSLYVKPAYRKNGVFKQMYAHLKSRAITSDAHRGLRLYVDKQNTIAKQAYTKVGMSVDHYELYEWMK